MKRAKREAIEFTTSSPPCRLPSSVPTSGIGSTPNNQHNWRSLPRDRPGSSAVRNTFAGTSSDDGELSVRFTAEAAELRDLIYKHLRTRVSARSLVDTA